MSKVKEEKKLTPKQEFRKKLVKDKNTAESYVVLTIYKNVDMFIENSVSQHDFHSPIWKVYLGIAEKAIKSGKRKLDDIVISLLLADKDNEVLRKHYTEFGGYATIANGINFVQEENFESYLTEVKKSTALIRLHDLGFPIMEQYEQYKAMEAEEIAQALEGALSSVFADFEVEEKVVDLKDNLWQTVMDSHEGKFRGFPYQSTLLNEYVNGQAIGNITMLSANSGIGKTFFTLAQVIPPMIEFQEKLLIMANEESETKWRRELITWAINNVLGGTFDKARFNQGKFSNEELALLKQGVDWLGEQMTKGYIQFLNFKSFSMKKAIKKLKQYAKVYNFKYFILDTLKLDSDAVNENTQAWLQLQQGMVKLYDVIKDSALNCHVYVTYQLGKSAMLSRYLSQNSLGVSKNVVDPITTLILVRKALESEKKDGSNQVTVKTRDGREVFMERGTEYFIAFLGKNRMGATARQLVFKVDMGRNIIEDFGTCIIEQDI